MGFEALLESSLGGMKNMVSSAAAHNISASVEFLLCFHDVLNDENIESEPDFSADEEVSSIEQVEQFFTSKNNMSIPIRHLTGDYDDWCEEEYEKLFQAKFKSWYRRIRSIELDEDELPNETQVIERELYEKSSDDYFRLVSEFREEHFAFEFVDYAKLKCKMMTDVMEQYDLEWPITVARSELQHDFLDEVSTQLSGIIGERVGLDSKDTKWNINVINSIVLKNDHDIAIRINSKNITVLDLITSVEKIVRWFVTGSGYTTTKTGYTLTLNLPVHETVKFDYVKLACFLGDKRLLGQVWEYSNLYLERAMSELNNLEYADIEQLDADMRRGLVTAMARVILDQARNKITSISLRNRYIQFKSYGNSFVKRLDVVTHIVEMYLKAVAIASDPSEKTGEYEQRLISLFGDDASVIPYINHLVHDEPIDMEEPEVKTSSSVGRAKR